MAITELAGIRSPLLQAELPHESTLDKTASAVSWGAILAGAVVAAAASMMLLSLGTGLGLSSISPWTGKGVQVSTFGVITIAWVILTQLCASALGGYLTGRLRRRWSATHIDEVHFRDTAHGLLSWAVASLLMAALLLLTVTGAVGTATQATATVAAGAAVAGTAAASADTTDMGQAATPGAGSMGYLIDSLFRAPAAGASANASALPVAEATRIFANSLTAANLPQQDVHYLGQLIAQRRGLTQPDAEQRVTDTFNALQSNIKDARIVAAEAAEKARSAGIQAALWLFVSLLAGAFIASLAATAGGRERDR